jgi:hypothetical protein
MRKADSSSEDEAASRSREFEELAGGEVLDAVVGADAAGADAGGRLVVAVFVFCATAAKPIAANQSAPQQTSRL